MKIVHILCTIKLNDENDEIPLSHLLCMNKQYFCQTKIQKYNRNMFYLLKCTSVDFFRLFGFWEEAHWLYTSFFWKNIYDLSICCFLEDFHLVLLLATIWRSNFESWESLLSEWLPFEIHFFLIINQKVGYPGKNSAVLKIYKILFPQKCFVFTRYIANM